MHGKKRVLVLDFDPDLLIALERLLEDSGFHTITTWDVDEALSLLETNGFDFFVVGNRPPDLDAAFLLEHARSLGATFGSFILGGGAINHDGLSNLIDCIRAFPCSTEQLRKPPTSKVREQEVVGWPW